MGIGAQIGTAAITIAVDIDLAILGIAILATVISGGIILTNVGGRGVQQHVRGWFMTIFWGLVLSGGAQLIGRTLQKVLTFA